MENETSTTNQATNKNMASNLVLAEVKPLVARGFPCICVSCPSCGNVFMGCILSAGILAEDKEVLKEIEDYARQGYTIDVRNAKDFKLYGCKCDVCVG